MYVISKQILYKPLKFYSFISLNVTFYWLIMLCLDIIVVVTIGLSIWMYKIRFYVDWKIEYLIQIKFGLIYFDL